MLLLTSTSDIIRVITSTAAAIDAHASYVDNLSSVFTPDRKNTLITTATTTTAVLSPAASTQRNVQFFSLSNDGVIDNLVTVEHFDGTTSVRLIKVNLHPGDMLQFVSGVGWNTIDSNGNVQTTMAVAAAGSDTQIQYNSGGTSLGANADLIWDNTNKNLVLGGTDTGINIKTITNEPAAPASGLIHIYGKSIAGRSMIKSKGPSGLDTPYQPALFNNNTVMWTPTIATAGFWQGSAGAGAGTFASVLPTTTNIFTSVRRGTWANIITTANQVLGQRTTEAQFFIGSNAGQGGFFFFARFGWAVYTAGSRLFVGMHTATTVVSAQPSAAANIIGFGMDSGDSAITFMHNTSSGTATKDTIAGQPTVASSQGYDAYIYVPPNSTTMYYRLDNLNTGATIIDSSTSTNTPLINTMMTAGVLASNAALTTATQTSIACNRIYVESNK